jgi:thiol-activated cytolysin
MKAGNVALTSLAVAAALVLAACSSKPTGPGDAASIGEYIQQIPIDPPSQLNVQDTGSQDVSRDQVSTEQSTEEVAGVGTKVCVRSTYDLKQNFDQVAVLRPTNGVIYPGALVKANPAMMDGLPEPITLPRAPVRLSIDLPGIGDHGVVTVSNPTNSGVQAAIDGALQWWNANAYQDGYVNASNSSYRYTSSFTSTQTGLDLGLNLSWATGDFAGQFNTFTSTTTTVVTAAYQQVFYTVTFDTPQDPEAVFPGSLDLKSVEDEVPADEPPAYVSSVAYGRILVFRMENTNSVTTTDLEAAFNYGVGRLAASGSLASTYQNILSTSKIEAISIGGNAAVATQLVTGDLLSVIQGPNAVYSRDNPGVPIAYTVKYLKDNRIAKLGYSTEYTTTECRMASMEVTLNLSNISVPGDCDGIEGDGEFDWAIWILDASGKTISSTSGSDTVPSGSTMNVGKKQHVFTLAASEGQKFTVRFRCSEWDRNILGQTYRDSRMDNATAEYTHVYRNGAWNAKSKTLVLGSTSDCKVSEAYSFSAKVL